MSNSCDFLQSYVGWLGRQQRLNFDCWCACKQAVSDRNCCCFKRTLYSCQLVVLDHAKTDCTEHNFVAVALRG